MVRVLAREIPTPSSQSSQPGVVQEKRMARGGGPADAPQASEAPGSVMGYHPFPVDEANAMLPGVRVALDQIQDLRNAAGSKMDQLAVLDALWGDLVSQSANPDHEEYTQHRDSLSECRRAIEDLIQQRLLDRNIRFPVGGLEHGLVDFPTTLDGRWVYLCWQSDEPNVAYWHEVKGGYAGRRPITAEERLRIGRLDDPTHHEDSALDF